MMRNWRNGTTTLAYNAADLVVTNTAPAPAAGQSAPVTVLFYDISLRQTGQRLPDGAVVTNAFLASGLMQRTWGSRRYPVEYTFDYAGRMKTMTTWHQFSQATGSGVSGSAVTTWNYDTARGWLTNKTYADGLGPVYTNTPAGRLGKRTWARSVSTVYSYNAAGDLASVDYSDTTPDLAYGYNRLGRQTAATNGAVALTRFFSDVGLLLSENHVGGPLAGLTVSNRYNAYLRRTNLWGASQFIAHPRVSTEIRHPCPRVSAATPLVFSVFQGGCKKVRCAQSLHPQSSTFHPLFSKWNNCPEQFPASCQTRVKAPSR